MRAWALAMLVAGLTPGDPAVTETVLYYDVSGLTADDIRASMNRRRPEGTRTRFGDGRTEWRLTWSHEYSLGANQCRLLSSKVTLAVTTTLPRWARPALASPELVTHWERYLRALTLHEAGHAENGRDALRALTGRLREMSTFEDCDSLEAAIVKAGKETVAFYSGADAAYDARTSHGLSQGASFP